MSTHRFDEWLANQSHTSKSNPPTVRAHTSNGTPVSVNWDELSIADRASVMPAAYEHAQISVSGGGHGIGNITSVKVYNGSHSNNPVTNNGTGKSTFMLVVTMIVLGFILYAIVTGGGQ